MNYTRKELEDFGLEFEPRFSEFVWSMRDKLMENMKRGKKGWNSPMFTLREMHRRIQEEIREAMETGAPPEEWSDVANFAFFAWYRSKYVWTKRGVRTYERDK